MNFLNLIQVSIVPVIAKSDCLTMSEIKKLKKRILDEIRENGRFCKDPCHKFV